MPPGALSRWQSWLPATLFLGYQAGDSLTQCAPIPKLLLSGAWGAVSLTAVAMSLPNAPTQGLWVSEGKRGGIEGVSTLEQDHRG